MTGLGPDARAPLAAHPDVGEIHILHLVMCCKLTHHCRHSSQDEVLLLGLFYWEFSNWPKDYDFCSYYGQGSISISVKFYLLLLVYISRKALQFHVVRLMIFAIMFPSIISLPPLLS